MKNELNTSNKEIDKINDSIDDISKDFINKKIIDLSFLDVINDDNVESQNYQNNINDDNINGRNNNYNYISNGYTMFNLEKSESNNMKGYFNEFSNESNLLNNSNNLKNNYNCYHPIAFNNNFIHNYNQINDSNLVNQDFQNNNISYNNNPSNKVKKYTDKKYLINIMDIRTNIEQRTTIRMLNIPKYFQPQDLAKKIDENFGISPQKENRIYDFICIPFNVNNKDKMLTNAGFAFINFVHPKHIIKFYSFFQ